jgi:putative PIN family toxin of toxin-antitoxin system
MMKRPEIVIDTNVLVAGLRSRRGASFMLLSLVGSGRFEINLSVPLVLEYEEVLLRTESGILLPRPAIEDILDYHCSVAGHHEIFFLWRPHLKDLRDDMVLELAVKAGCQFIITFNLRDFAGCERFRIRPLPPAEFLRHIGVIV